MNLLRYYPCHRAGLLKLPLLPNATNAIESHAGLGVTAEY
jgi:hypothetical protein